MTISGFTMAKNTAKLYYPIREAIESILPIVDEFVVALGDCDEDDHTLEAIEAINSPKVKIVHTIWDIEAFPNGMENAHQTDIAKSHCKGDWAFYLQADEVVHEKYLDIIGKKCEYYLADEEVEGLLFDYLHFFGDYDHHINFHGWYPNEIRVVRNKPDIHSFQSAQSFRRIPDFDGKSYRKKEGTFKLKVARADAYVYHYGWVRPPELMQKKAKALETIHKGKEKVAALYASRKDYFDYGNLSKLPLFKGTHPKVMETFIQKFYWKDQLHFEKNHQPQRPLMKHEKLKARLLTFIEQKVLGGKQLFAYSNWEIIE